ncbi:MAG: hypothetical protein ACYDHM_10560 [Acidiferrobacterales bacterium]
MIEKLPDSEPHPGPLPEVARVWLLSWVHSLFLPLLILATQRFVPGRPLLPAAGPYTLLAGVLLVIPSIPVLRRYWQTSQEGGVGGASRFERTMILRRRLMIGVSFADFPALAGVMYYFFTRNTVRSLLLCGATVVLVSLYRPASKRPEAPQSA